MTSTAAPLRREEATLAGVAGLKLFERRWLPDGEPKALVVLIHGYAEHTGRYDHVGARLAAAGIAVRGFDLRGHGLSDGPRALISTVREYLDDLRAYLPQVQREHPAVPIFVLGHSMGGCIAALWLAVDRPPLSGALLSGPALTSGAPNPLGPVLRWLGRVAPALPLMRLRAEQVSRDPAVVRRYEADPLVYHGRMKAGLLSAMLRAIERIDRDAARIDAPLLLMHGSDDALTSPEGSRRLHERVSSADRTLKVYQGLFHEILNEPEQDQVLGDIVAWIQARIQPAFTVPAAMGPQTAS